MDDRNILQIINRVVSTDSLEERSSDIFRYRREETGFGKLQEKTVNSKMQRRNEVLFTCWTWRPF